MVIFKYVFEGISMVETVDDLRLEWVPCELAVPINAGSGTNNKYWKWDKIKIEIKHYMKLKMYKKIMKN